MTAIAMGIDVDSRNLEICVVIDEDASNAVRETVPNQQKDFHRILKCLKQQKISRVLMEASGGYEQNVANYLTANGLDVYVVNPRQARNFARGIGLNAKTDKIDAFALGRMAQVAKLPPKVRPRPNQVKLKQWVTRRSKLMENMQAERNRKRLADAEMKESIQTHIQFLKKEIEQIEKRIEEIIRSDESMAAKKRVLTQFKGIGDKTAAAMLGLVPELGYISNEKVSSLVGLAPMANDSGTFKGKRFITGGRTHARKALYMPAWVTVQRDPVMTEFYQRLISRGKLKKVSIVAVMRKMLVRMNAAIRNYIETEEKKSNQGITK